MLNTRLIEMLKPVWAVEPKNYTGAAITKQWASMKLYDRLLILIQTGAWAGGTAAVTLKQAVDVSGTSSKALAITEMWVNTALAPDTFTKTAVVANTFNLDTANLLYVIEVKAIDLDNANSFDCVSIDAASPGSNADLYGVVYLGAAARYPDASLPSMLSN